MTKQTENATVVSDFFIAMYISSLLFDVELNHGYAPYLSTFCTKRSACKSIEKLLGLYFINTCLKFAGDVLIQVF